MLSLPDKVTVVDVAARDGLQSFHRWVDTDVKVAMVDRLSDAGFPVVEVTNFAHPRVIPHLRDAEEVMARIRRRPGTVYRGQAPNPRGAERAVAAKVDEVLGLITASEAYNLKNQNMTIEKGVDAAIATFRIADAAGIPFLLAIGMSFWCAYDGPIPEERVLGLVARFRDAGIRRFYLAGSLGMEDARHVGRLFRGILDRHGDVELGYHVHNLAGTGTANILAALDAGASFIEGSICGIGGGIMTPTSMASVGNIPTEDIVHMLNDMGIDTGVSTAEAVAAAGDIAEMLGIEPRSHVVHAGTRASIMRSAALNQREHPL
ncbi:MAG: hydroxymethylglutaryl-CoA lyase [Alphaproteobacteria bacterium]|nr:hydroxymethylglutaryl-CoA lyase [Alphaproteobacteria bacterium]